jgi:hypothetical protein
MVEGFALTTFHWFLPNARLQSSLLDSVQSLLKMGRTFDVKRHFPESRLGLNQPATTISSKGPVPRRLDFFWIWESTMSRTNWWPLLGLFNCVCSDHDLFLLSL